MLIWPEYTTAKRWAGHLLEIYPNEFLPILRDEDEWRKWATTISSSGIFEEVGIKPPSSSHEDWNSWAKDFYKLVIEQPDFGIR